MSVRGSRWARMSAMPVGTRTRARVRWIDSEWDWSRYQAVEHYLRQTVSPYGAKQGVTVEVRDRERVLGASSLAEARAQLIDESHVPTEIKLIVSTHGTVTRM